ncbi:MAG: TonB-dependent receptor [Rubrivivax sp.]|nr:TonB-dependent receptor [Rubrivivax sp.]
MFKRTRINTGALIALGGTLLAVGVSAQAQTAERIEITGSRIKSLGAISNSPITSIGTTEINASQPVAVEEVIRGLPAAVPAIGPGTNNGSGGIATIDLRGLGPTRTLVLVNGRRAVPSDLFGRVDTNAIPVALLERIDIVTGGASAVYGADAVAGVVNFVLKKNFTGVEASTSYGVSEKGDSKRYRTDVTVGANLAEGKGNVALSFGTTRTNPLTQGERDFGEFQLSSTNGARSGSPTAAPGTFGGIPAPFTGTQIIDATTGGLRPAVEADNFNFNPLNYFVTPLERTQMSAISRYTINDFAEVYAELTHTKSKVTLNLAPSGSFASAGFPNWKLPVGNPFIPDAMRSQLCSSFLAAELAKATATPPGTPNPAVVAALQPANCVVGNPQEVTVSIGRRFVEFGPRVNTFDNTTSQWTAGLRGAVPMLSNWSYDAYLQSGSADQLSARINWGSATKFQQALRAVSTTTCTVGTGGCVPINVFGAPGTITPQMLAFINQTAVQTTFVTQKVGQLSVSGDLGTLKSPYSKDPISLALGYETREVAAGNRSDAPSQINGEVLGTGAPLPDRTGKIKLSEGFLETVVPLAGGMAGLQSLNFEGGYRESEFKTEVSSKTYGSWKYGLDYSPIKGLRFRAMKQRATRAPNINELYAPVVSGLATRAVDPCQLALTNAGDANTAGTLSNLCRATGVPLAQIGAVPAPSSGQISNTGGGNPALSPEEADTTTMGVVWEPEFVAGLSLTLDYYKINIDQAVSSATTNQVLDGCYSSTLNAGFSTANPFCALIQRNPTTGSLNGAAGVITQSSNLGKVGTEGYDLGISYRLGLKDWGRVDLSMQATRVVKSNFKSLPSTATIECVGLYGADCGGPTPRDRWSQRATWTIGNYTAGYNWRHVGPSKVQGGNFLAAFASIKSFNYIDLNFAWDATKNVRLSLSINNATDSQPPVVGNTIATTSTNSGNTFPQWYDVVGRQYTMGARVKF